jgi:sulfate transport system permease protein
VESFRVTLTVSVAVAVINLFFGLLVAWVLTRDDFPGKRLVDAIIDLPFAVSPVVIGLSLYLLYGTDGWFGPALADAGIKILFSTPGIILACTFVSLPFVVREVVPVLHEIGTEQEQAATSLGARPWQTFLRITLPSIRWALVYGVVLSLARSLGEFGAVKIISGNVADQTQTATLVVEQKYQDFEQGSAYATSFLLAAIAVAALVVVTVLRPKENPDGD